MFLAKVIQIIIIILKIEHLKLVQLHKTIKGIIQILLIIILIGYNKETPHIYRAALEVLGTKKDETVVFEDALHALITAKKDGFKVAAVYDRHERNQTQMKENGDYYITDFKTAQI